MPTPFASGYAPINLLNDSIQAQAARQQQGYLQASQFNEASISDALNRVIQQKAIEQQGRNQQQHYGLQQQQLANDLAYRNQALAAGALQEKERASQFYAKLTQDKILVDAQAKALGRDNPYSIQSEADAETYNREALNGESEANQIKAALDKGHQIESDKIKRAHYWTEKGRKDDLDKLDSAYAVSVAKINGQVKHGDKIRVNPITGKFEALQIPTRGGKSSSSPTPDIKPDASSSGGGQPNFGESGFDSGAGMESMRSAAPDAIVSPQVQAAPFSSSFGDTAKAVGAAMFTPWTSFGLFGSGRNPEASVPAPTPVVSEAQSNPFGGISWSRGPGENSLNVGGFGFSSTPPGFVQPQPPRPGWAGQTNAPAPFSGIGWSRTAPLQQSAPVQQGAPQLVNPIPQNAVVDGVHYRRNADGTTTTLVPILTSSGRVIPAYTTGTFRNQ